MSKSRGGMSLPQREPASPVIRLSPQDVPSAPIEALYVHIPFCFHKCHYCDFYSITKQTPQRMTAFVDLLLAEAELWTNAASPGHGLPANVNLQPENYGRDAHATQRLHPAPRTVFFGGGTPSLLPMDAMHRLIVGLKQRFDLSRVDEWTIEVNPATANLEYLQMLRELGVNRLSFGAQSFDRDELKMLERHHEPDDVVQSIDMARKAGFERLNVDLIYAIPGQTLESWDRSIRQALALGTTHLSCYGLTYEPNTAMTVRKRLGQFTPAADELELEMFAHVRHTLKSHGIEWYEISNYVKPGEECRHNLVYWQGGNYIGIGPSAASHVSGHRFKNRPHLGEWEAGVPSGMLPVIEHEVLTPEQRLHESIMLQIRLRQGVRWSSIPASRDEHAETVRKLESLGLIAVTDNGFHLTEVGMNVADAIVAEFA